MKISKFLVLILLVFSFVVVAKAASEQKKKKKETEEIYIITDVGDQEQLNQLPPEVVNEIKNLVAGVAKPSKPEAVKVDLTDIPQQLHKVNPAGSKPLTLEVSSLVRNRAPSPPPQFETVANQPTEAEIKLEMMKTRREQGIKPQSLNTAEEDDFWGDDVDETPITQVPEKVKTQDKNSETVTSLSTNVNNLHEELRIAKLYLEGPDVDDEDDEVVHETDNSKPKPKKKDHKGEDIIQDTNHAIHLYEEIARKYDDDSIALYNLGVIHKTGQFNRFNLAKSRMYFMLSALKGNPSAQFEVAYFYSNELVQPVVDLENVRNYILKNFNHAEHTTIAHKILKSLPQYIHEDHEAVGLINYFSSAIQGNVASNIVLAYRHLYGYGVPKSCQTAAYYYKTAGEKIKHEFQLGTVPLIEKVRLTDHTALQQKQTQEDVMDYYQYSAEKGSASSQLIVGYANMYGLRGLQQNGHIARQYFERAAQAGEAEAFAALGNMYAKGLGGVPQSNSSAFKYFEKGAKLHDASSLNGLGYMYLHGSTGDLKLERNYQLAAQYFNESASQGNSEAQYNLGLMYLTGLGTAPNYQKALHYMTLSAHQGQIMARYQLGLMYLDGLGTVPDCEVAVKFLKNVVEKGTWTHVMELAFEKYVQDEMDTALLLYQEMAEQGLEVAQSNLAFMYERGYGVKAILENITNPEDLEREQMRRALFWYKRAAELGNVEAYVKVGDYYYYGGTDMLTQAENYEKSVYHYRRASELRNAQAMFNLGFMHEHGQGLPQDFHLAKRYYDMASDTDPVAYVPVLLALCKMYAHWGMVFVKQYLTGELKGVSIWTYFSSTGEGTKKEDLLHDTIEDTTWEWAASHEDLILTILGGLFLFLLLVRYVFVNTQRQAIERLRARQEALARQLERERQQQQIQAQ